MANEAEETFTLMKQSCAYRVKYAVKDKDGKREITKKGLFSTGCHTGNRGGVHPQGQRVKTLCQGVLAPDMGWDQEEVSFGGCVVQEVPEDKRPRGYVTYHEWALLECRGFHPGGAVRHCFFHPHNMVFIRGKDVVGV